MDSASDIVEQSSDEAMICQDGVWYKEIVERDGKWYKRITPEHAQRIRKDVQLFEGGDSSVFGPVSYPSLFSSMHDWSPEYWKKWKWYIEVDSPNKEEYNPSDTETR